MANQAKSFSFGQTAQALRFTLATMFASLLITGCEPVSEPPLLTPEPVDPEFGPIQRMNGVYAISQERREFGQCSAGPYCLDLEDSCWFTATEEAFQTLKPVLDEHGLSDEGYGTLRMEMDARRKGGNSDDGGYGHMSYWSCEVQAVQIHKIEYFDAFSELEEDIRRSGEGDAE